MTPPNSPSCLCLSPARRVTLCCAMPSLSVGPMSCCGNSFPVRKLGSVLPPSGSEAASRVADIGAHLMDQVEALMVRQDKQRRLDAKRKADQERRAQEDAACQEQEQILQYLAANPEPGALTDDTHHPTGDLHALDPPDKEHLDPALEAEDNVGDLPAEIEDEP